MRRSEISKATWRKRKREGGKATCAFCGMAIYSGGVTKGGFAWHKGCLEAKMAGLTPRQMGKNPRRSRDSYQFYGAKGLNPRPPAKWWATMWARTAASYPKKASESLEKYRADISRIVGGIWYKFPGATRARLIKRYEGMATPARALANPLPCPCCGVLNPVSRANLYMRCSGCGRPLRSVKVIRK